MERSSTALPVPAGHSAAFAFLELPEAHPVRDIQRVTALVIGLLSAFGHPVERTSQSAARQALMETSDFELSLKADNHRLGLSLRPTDEAVGRVGHETEALLARIVRALCPVLEPVSIFWNGKSAARKTADWLAAFRPFRPRRPATQHRRHQPRPLQGSGVAIWPNRPQDLGTQPRIAPRPASQTDAMSQSARYAAWKPAGSEPDLAKRFETEPLIRRAGSWTLTATTAVLFPPAGAAMAVLNLGKGTSLRLNLHVLTLTLVIMSVYQSGALATMLRTLGL